MSVAEIPPENLLTLAEAARRIHRQQQTLHNWISTRKLGGAQGLVYVGRTPLVNWPKFAAAFLKEAA